MVVLGATGKLGRAVVRELARVRRDKAAPWGEAEIRVVVRPASVGKEEVKELLGHGVVVVTAEVTDEQKLGEAFAGADVVVSALGPRTNTEDQPGLFEASAKAVVRAAKAAGVKRLVAVAGAGVVMAGEPVPFGRRMVVGLMRLVAKHVLEAKEREVAVILADSGSELEWTIARPGGMFEAPRTGRVATTLEGGPPSMRVSYGDVAEFMVRAANQQSAEFVRKAPFVGCS